MTQPTESHDPVPWLSFERLVSVLNSMGSLWIVVLMVVINIDILGRTLFNLPLRGVPELIKLSIVGIVFIQLGHTLRSGRMTRSDGLLRLMRRINPRLSHGLTLLFNLLGAGLFALLFNASMPFFQNAWFTGEYVGIQGYVSYPVWPVRLIILVGCAVTSIQYLLFAWRDTKVFVGLMPPADPQDSSAFSEMLK